MTIALPEPPRQSLPRVYFVVLALFVFVTGLGVYSYRYYSTVPLVPSHPKDGYMCFLVATNRSLVGTNGWIAPDSLDRAVVLTLQSFGLLDSTQTKTLDSWKDRTRGGLVYDAWGGRYATFPFTVPDEILNRLPESKVPDIGTNSKFILVIDYWTDRCDGEPPPGYINLAIQLQSDTGSGGSFESVTQPIMLATVSEVILEKLNKIQP